MLAPYAHRDLSVTENLPKTVFCKYFYKSQKSATDNSAGTFLVYVTCLHRSIPKTVKKFFLDQGGNFDHVLFSGSDHLISGCTTRAEICEKKDHRYMRTTTGTCDPCPPMICRISQKNLWKICEKSVKICEKIRRIAGIVGHDQKNLWFLSQIF